jgi:hypothetical protein
MVDITFKPNPWAPGYWIISAGSDRGSQWWASEHYPDIGWNLGEGSYVWNEVQRVLLEMPAGLTACLNGRHLLMAEREATANG